MLQIKLWFGLPEVVLVVTFLLLWQNVMEKVTYRRRGFFRVSVSEGLPRSGTWGARGTPGTGALVESLYLLHEHEVERKTFHPNIQI